MKTTTHRTTSNTTVTRQFLKLTKPFDQWRTFHITEAQDDATHETYCLDAFTMVVKTTTHKFNGLGNHVTGEQVCDQCQHLVKNEQRERKAGAVYEYETTYHCTARNEDISEPERTHCNQFNLDDGQEA